ncbi:MAG: ABATE domain-containing protein [Acidimicrobiia bacterium]
MDFSHYSDEPVHLAVDLVNTDEIDGDEIADLSDLIVFLDRFEGLRSPGLGPATDTDLARIHQLRDTLRQVFEAPDEATAVARLNSVLAENAAIPRLSLHSGEPHLHFEPVEAMVSSWVGAMTAMGLAGVIVEHGISRFGSCSAANCRDVFIDTTRNRSRLHCCNTCSTREAVAAYRKRHATA